MFRISHEAPANFRLQMFYDGDCPLCVREASFLARLDRRRRRIWFTDIAAPDFDAHAYGTTQAELMARIRARLPSGQWIEGVEVFRQVYAAVGLGWLLAFTRLPGLRQLADWAYTWFAKNRLRLTGRGACETGTCVPRAVD